METLYDVLKIREDAPPEVVRAAYKTLSSMYHPDKNPGDVTAAEMMQKINNAYHVLRDPDSRARYDEDLRQAKAQAYESKNGAESRGQPEETTSPPESNPSDASNNKQNQEKKSTKFDFSFWGSVVISVILARLFGFLGALIAFAVFHYLSSRIGKAGSAVVAITVSALTSLFIGHLINTDQVAHNSTTQAVHTTAAPVQPYSAPTPTTPIRRPSDDLAEKRHFDEIYAAHPDAHSIAGSGNFTRWLSGPGKTWEDVVERGTAAQIISMLNSYKADIRLYEEAKRNESRVPISREAPAPQSSTSTQTPKSQPTRAVQPPPQRKSELTIVTEKMYADYPYLATREGRGILEKIFAHRDGLINQGQEPAAAMQSAISTYAHANDPRNKVASDAPSRNCHVQSSASSVFRFNCY